MVLPVGFFMPLPLPMMIPFMGIQSAIMAEQFGTMFQYGKRRISAMSNEEFNALTFEKLQSQMTKQIQGMIPEMQNQIKAMQPMVQMILEEFGNYIRIADETIRKELLKSGSAIDQITHLIGQHTHEGGETLTTTTSTKVQGISDHDDLEHSKTGKFDAAWYERLAPYYQNIAGTTSTTIKLEDTISVSDVQDPLQPTGTETQKSLTVVFFGETLTEGIARQRILTAESQIQAGAQQLTQYSIEYNNCDTGDCRDYWKNKMDAIKTLSAQRLKNILTMRTAFQTAFGYWA